MVRLVIEWTGYYNLEKDKRGDFKTCEGLQYMAAMQHPGGGKNDIPNRLKRNFFLFNMVLPEKESIKDIYDQMMTGRFAKEAPETINVSKKLSDATYKLWTKMKERMLPTPAKFHYIFNLRELSRVFQGIMLVPNQMKGDISKSIFKTGGFRCEQGKSLFNNGGSVLVRIWKHECCRVFSDKLTNDNDKKMYEKFMDQQMEESFPECLEESRPPFYMASFLRPDVMDEDGMLVEDAPKVYEPGGSLLDIRPIADEFLKKLNTEMPAKKMELVLFNDALEHLLRINRLMEMPRGSGLLVGVGGSGKQSLTRLSSFISKANVQPTPTTQTTFQITLTKMYGKQNFLDDIKELYKNAGQKCKSTTFLFTESEIKDEVFLEYLNSVLLTGEIPNLFDKSEILGITSDLKNKFLKERPGLEDSQDNLKQFFIDKVRDNLHIFICMSPMNPKFPERARKFPGLVSCPTINWFLPWPKDALVALSTYFIKDFKELECGQKEKTGLMTHMGTVHSMVTDVCEEYFVKMRRRVYQTPKSYLSFIQNFRLLYKVKIDELKNKEKRVNLGLEKLINGAKDVDGIYDIVCTSMDIDLCLFCVMVDMKVVLAEEQIKLQKEEIQTKEMLAQLEVSRADANREKEKVTSIKAQCESDAMRIGAEKEQCEADLASAKPFVEMAEKAIDSIENKDINEIKVNKNPTPIIQLIFDGILILFKKKLNPVVATSHLMTVKDGAKSAKELIPFCETSFRPEGQKLLGNSTFLADVREFGRVGKDQMNEETIELISPYLDMPKEAFNSDAAKSASKAAEGLCTWVIAMRSYHQASKIVKPKLEALSLAEASLKQAQDELAKAQQMLESCEAKLQGLQNMYEEKLASKRQLEETAGRLKHKMLMASQLIDGLSGERKRWTADSENFKDLKNKLVGDCAASCAFVSYSGPFNQDYRNILLTKKCIPDCEVQGVPISPTIDVISFMVDLGTIGDWNQQGLPNDPLSIQNGILVTKSSRFPLMIDPQGQAVNWIKSKESSRLPVFGSVALNDPKIKDRLESAMGDGKALIITGVEEEIDPMFDPVLEKQFIEKNRKKTVIVSDKAMDYDDNFMMYFITRLPNPSFSPELQAKTTVVDFTVTMKGLEEQLLGKVIGREQKSLEDQLNDVLEQVNSNQKSLMQLDAELLSRLTDNTGNLLDDEELIGVLQNTKTKAADVNLKLIAAAETKASIAESREKFRPVATRGSILYFSIVEMSGVNCMYQTSLSQFLVLFMDSMEKADKATLVMKRVTNIIESMTYIVYRYINRGLYEADKLTFVVLVTLKILITAGQLKSGDMDLFIKGGAGVDADSAKKNPFKIPLEVWYNIIELSNQVPFFRNLPNDMQTSKDIWLTWLEHNEPETLPIPEYESRLSESNLSSGVAAFYKLMLVRSLRKDRCMLQCKTFVKNVDEMGPKFVEPVTDTIESIYDGMVAQTPVIFLLSIGADPTESIVGLAKKKKLPEPATVSMGEGQSEVAKVKMVDGARSGTWVLLQNCELGLDLMVQMEELLENLRKDNMHPGFRLFITALPERTFPLGLLQMSTKVTNEPPAGLKAGVLRSYTVIVDQEKIDKVDNATALWRQLLFALCFMHSVVQERRKFGSLGWCIPYEYNNGDLNACIQFLENHLSNGAISWPTLQYMVSEAQYGGKITDSMDRRLFKTYTEVWLQDKTCATAFKFNPDNPVNKNLEFVYKPNNFDQLPLYANYIKSFPDIDSPEIFGLHPNADISFRNKEVSALFSTLSETQPKGGGGGGGDGMSREETVLKAAQEMKDKIPEFYVEEEFRAKLMRGKDGLVPPLNIFLYQEIQRLQSVMSKVKFMLEQLRLAINGEVVMTEELQTCLDSIYAALVPRMWMYTVAGDEFSWLIPTLTNWMTSLGKRDDQNREWLNRGRPTSYWFPGFFNPQGFLTAMKQEVCRIHKPKEKGQWALDEIIYSTEVQQSVPKEAPSEGVYIYGLFLEGAGWDIPKAELIESAPKVLFVPLPHVLASAVKGRKSESLTIYDCPCYKYRNRTDRFFIFHVTLRTSSDKTRNHWILRNVGLLCNDD
jgi:dynein heavy chain